MGRHAADSEHRGEKVRSGAEMGDGAEEFHTVPLLLKGVFGGGSALDLNPLRLHLKGLLGVGSQHDSAGYDKSGAHVLVGYLLIILDNTVFKNNLKGIERASVVELNEAEVLQIPDGAGPAAHSDGLSVKSSAVFIDFRDFRTFHICVLNSYFFLTIIT